MLYQVKSSKTDQIKKYFVRFLLGETKYFAMSADFVVLCLFVPIRMEHISKILQTNLLMDPKIRYIWPCPN